MEIYVSGDMNMMQGAASEKTTSAIYSYICQYCFFRLKAAGLAISLCNASVFNHARFKKDSSLPISSSHRRSCQRDSLPVLVRKLSSGRNRLNLCENASQTFRIRNPRAYLGLLDPSTKLAAIRPAFQAISSE